MVGLICGTCCQGSELTHASMDGHDPDGPTLCIHSVAVAEKLRRRGYATTLLKVCMKLVYFTTSDSLRFVLFFASRGLV